MCIKPSEDFVASRPPATPCRDGESAAREGNAIVLEPVVQLGASRATFCLSSVPCLTRIACIRHFSMIGTQCSNVPSARSIDPSPTFTSYLPGVHTHTRAPARIPAGCQHDFRDDRSCVLRGVRAKSALQSGGSCVALAKRPLVMCDEIRVQSGIRFSHCCTACSCSSCFPSLCCCLPHRAYFPEFAVTQVSLSLCVFVHKHTTHVEPKRHCHALLTVMC